MSEQISQKKYLGIIGKTMIYAFALSGIVFILVLIGLISILNPSSKNADIPDRAFLHIDFNRSYTEIRSEDLWSELTGEENISVFDLVRSIYTASEDPRILALSANIEDTSLGVAQIQEIISAIDYFKQTGKKTYIFSAGMGSFGGGNRDYYLASAFDEIWLQPTSDIGLTGIGIEVPFFKDLFEKIGLQAEFYTRYEYKTAVSSLTDSRLSSAFREELNKLGGNLFDQLTQTVSVRRNLPIEQVIQNIDQAPLSTDEAKEAGLIDKIGYKQTFIDNIKQTYQAEPVSLTDYMAQFQNEEDKDKTSIALLVLEGEIEEGTNTDNPLGQISIASENVREILDEISQNENIKALILRINSPGGSYSASDEIRFALESFKKEKNIPIIVSMGDYAASGGYFIALPADRIIAEPATLTGSIGVLGGKFVFEKLWKKLGINWDGVRYGQNADILSMNKPFSKKQKELFDRSLDRIYADFTKKTIQARNLEPEKTDQIARGRVWLGAQALELGLIDELGGITTAISRALETAQIDPEEEYNIVYYPRAKNFKEKLMSLIESGNRIQTFEIFNRIGTDPQIISMFNRLRFDAVLPPIIFNF